MERWRVEREEEEEEREEKKLWIIFSIGAAAPADSVFHFILPLFFSLSPSSPFCHHWLQIVNLCVAWIGVHPLDYRTVLLQALTRVAQVRDATSSGKLFSGGK